MVENTVIDNRVARILLAEDDDELRGVLEIVRRENNPGHRDRCTKAQRRLKRKALVQRSRPGL